MSETFEKPVSVPAGVATAKAVKWLQANGYQLGASRDGEAHLLHGTTRHRLEVRADGQTMRFEFANASEDRATLEARVDRLVAEVTSGTPQVSRAASVRCPACNTQSKPGETSCAVCGSRL